MEGLGIEMHLSASSILMNGSPARYFKSSRSLKQGDPFHHFPFLLMVKAQEGVLNKASERGTIEGFKVGNGGRLITHLQFADDTLIFCKDCQS